MTSEKKIPVRWDGNGFVPLEDVDLPIGTEGVIRCNEVAATDEPPIHVRHPFRGRATYYNKLDGMNFAQLNAWCAANPMPDALRRQLEAEGRIPKDEPEPVTDRSEAADAA
jgi:hypothetical protein